MNEKQPPTQREIELFQAKKALDAGQPDNAWEVATYWLMENINDAEANYICAGAAELATRWPTAYHFAKRSTELRPEKWQAWLLLSHICINMWRYEESERAARRAIKLANSDDAKATALNNLGCLYQNYGEFDRSAPFFEEAVKLMPSSRKARGNWGITLLAQRDWERGWIEYSHTLGLHHRRKVQYGSEPEWDGAKNLRVAVYAEQGLGDEISFSSMLPDAAKDCEHLIFDCDPRLKGLFERSFPQVKVYGTRKQRMLDWSPEDQQIHASIPVGELGKFYRNDASKFTGEPWLTPCPIRTEMWRQRWKSVVDPMTLQRKPVFGIAWSGGIHRTGSQFRKWSLEDLAPILEAVQAHWVCLEYKDAQFEIDRFCEAHPTVDLNQYRFATLTQDYDDTAALVASLDGIVSMQTAVVHLAGALGVKADVFVPMNSQWRYGEKFDTLPWYNSVSVIRQTVRGHWKNAIAEYADTLAGNTKRRARAA